MASVEKHDPVEWILKTVSGKADTYRIINAHGCRTGHHWCGAELSWDTKSPHPMASVEFNDPVEWKFEARDDGFIIKNQYPGTWFNAELSWDTKFPHPMASVEFDNTVIWKLEEVKSVQGGRRLRTGGPSDIGTNMATIATAFPKEPWGIVI